MTLLLRDEVELRLGLGHCRARLRRAGRLRRSAAQWQCNAEGERALMDALASLLNSGHPLPRRVRLVLCDELVHFSMFAATMSRSRAEAEAHAHFRDKIGDSSHPIACHLAPGGHTWVAAATCSKLLAEVNSCLSSLGLWLANLEVAILADLRWVAKTCASPCALVGLVRDRGVTLVSLQRGGVVHVTWEGCDTTQPDKLASQVQDCVLARLLHAKCDAGEPAGVDVSVFAQEPQHQQWLADTVRGMGWALMRPGFAAA